MLQRESYDVVVTDVEMPNVNGPALLEWIHQYRPALERRVLVMTGGARSGDRHQWLATLDPASVLMKPFSLSMLSGAIGRVIARGAP